MYNIAFFNGDIEHIIKAFKTEFIPRKNDIVELQDKKYLVDQVTIGYDDIFKIIGIDVMCK